MHFERHAREVMALSIDKTELNGLFAQRRSFAQDSINTGHDNSISIAVIENRIKTLLCLT